MSPKPKVGVVLTTMNFKWTDLSLPDMLANTKYPYNLYLVDDESTDASREKLETYKVNILQNRAITNSVDEVYLSFTDGRRLGIPHAWNRGILDAIKDNCEYVVILNNDICFPNKTAEPCWLEKLTTWIHEHPEQGWVTPNWLWKGEPPDGFTSFKNSCEEYIKGPESHKVDDGAFACFMIMRVAMIKDMMEREKDKPLLQNMDVEPFPGLFDEKNFRCTWEDVDYCTRLRYHGWKNAVIHSVVLGHKGSGTCGSETWQKVIRQDYEVGHVNFCNKYRLPGPNEISSFRVSCCIYEFDHNGPVRWDQLQDFD